MDRYQYTDEERGKIVAAYFRHNSVTHTQRQFMIDFPGRHPPTRLTIYRIVNKFKDTGNVVNANKGKSGRPKTARSPANIENVSSKTG